MFLLFFLPPTVGVADILVLPNYSVFWAVDGMKTEYRSDILPFSATFFVYPCIAQCGI